MRQEVGIDGLFLQLDQFWNGSIAEPDVEEAIDVATEGGVAIASSLGLGFEGAGRVGGLEPSGERRKENGQQDGDGFIEQQLSHFGNGKAHVAEDGSLLLVHNSSVCSG